MRCPSSTIDELLERARQSPVGIVGLTDEEFDEFCERILENVHDENAARFTMVQIARATRYRNHYRGKLDQGSPQEHTVGSHPSSRDPADLPAEETRS